MLVFAALAGCYGRISCGGIYAVVGLRLDGRTYKRLAHRLAAEAFGLLAPGSKQQIDHRRGVVASRREILHGSRPHDHSSSYKGVSFNRARRKWFALYQGRRSNARHHLSKSG